VNQIARSVYNPNRAIPGLVRGLDYRITLRPQATAFLADGLHMYT